MKDKIIRIAPILLIIAIAILAIATLVTIGQSFFGTDEQKVEEKSKVEEPVEDWKTNEPNRSVKMTVRGLIVANENFRSYTVEVSQSKRVLTTYKGYLGEVIKQVSLPNSPDAYDQFIHALDKANMMKGQSFSGKEDDLLGVCATGHLYDFSVLKNGTLEKHLWTSTCRGSVGSLKANTQQLQNLFISQIPDHQKVVKDLGIDELSRR